MQAAQNNNGKKKAVLFVDDEKIVLEVGSADAGYEWFRNLSQVKKIQPNTKIILTSGYSGDQPEKRSERIGFDGFIQKPFNLKQLSEKIEYIGVNDVRFIDIVSIN